MESLINWRRLLKSKYDLYKPIVDPSIRPKLGEEGKKWNELMNAIRRYFDGKMTILDMALRHGLPYNQVWDYAKRFEEKGLVEFVPVV